MVVRAAPTGGGGGGHARRGGTSTAGGGSGGGGGKRGADDDADATERAGAGSKKVKLATAAKPKIVPRFKAVPKSQKPLAPVAAAKETESVGRGESGSDDEGAGLGGLLGYGSGSDDE
jgi:hypothetical protein